MSTLVNLPALKKSSTNAGSSSVFLHVTRAVSGTLAGLAVTSQALYERSQHQGEPHAPVHANLVHYYQTRVQLTHSPIKVFVRL